jgi:hypothetical protein
MSVFERVRRFIRDWFTRFVLASEQADAGGDGVRAARTSKRKYRRVAVAPSERFVWGMVTLIIALVGVIVLEAVNIIVTGTVNSEMLAVVSGLVGSLVTAFVMGKKS